MRAAASRELEKQRLLREWQQEGIPEAVLQAFQQVPREAFVESHRVGEAYLDFPLPIGQGQTISQPTTVMLMLKWLEVGPEDTVLEIGTGSGYNAALLAVLAKQVVSIERHPELVAFARSNLAQAGFRTVAVQWGDGKQGAPEAGPYSRIVLTAASEALPPALLEQLEPGGLLLAPIGAPQGCTMTRVRKTPAGLESEALGRFSFVPLV